MNLQQIILENNKDSQAINFETMQPYLRSLYAYYKDLFCCEPVLMVTDVFNACSYVKIVSSNDFNESVCTYIGCDVWDLENNDDLLNQYETINFNSRLLNEFIN